VGSVPTKIDKIDGSPDEVERYAVYHSVGYETTVSAPGSTEKRSSVCSPM
jgi:hypothetical protein